MLCFVSHTLPCNILNTSPVVKFCQQKCDREAHPDRSSRAASPSHSAAGDAALPLVLCNLLNREFSGAKSPGGEATSAGAGFGGGMGGLRRFGSFRGRMGSYKFPHKDGQRTPDDDIEG